ncbi:hypothetical protein CspHIS471_0304860 [Cutaneotrichosporon sp. HIS471]|nr:hypothetical protein CspHIS471_0304860 [Cutaneotrichosporon sp. HIS471]
MAQLTLERPLSELDLAIQSHSELLHNALQLDEVDALAYLPPPPAPFPMEQLALLLATSGERQSLEDDRVSDVLSDAGTDASDVTVSVQYDYDDMTELNLVGIQRHCANCIEILVPPQRTTSVSSADQELAGRLTELLEATYELETFHPSSACCSPATPADDESDQSPFLALVHTLLGAQAVVAQRQPRPAPQGPSSETSEHPVEVVREELAWARVETLARDIVELVRSRDDEAAPCFTSEEEDDVKSIFSLPPVYRRSERDSAGSGSSRVSAGSVSSRFSGPPAYKDCRDDRVVGEPASAVSGKDSKSAEISSPRSMHSALSSIAPILNDLDTVTHAIERLHTITPQLDDQRIALRTPSQRRAKPAPLNLRQPTEARLRELDDLWDKIERAHAPIKDAAVDDRRLSRKSYMFRELPPTPASAPMSRVASRNVSRSVSRTRSTREDHERTTFLEELVESSGSARLRDQDVPLRPRSALPKPNGYLAEAIDRSPGRLGSQDFPIPLETFLANKRKQAAERLQNPTVTISDNASIRSCRSSLSIKSSKSSTLKARRKPKDLFQIVADASGSRFPNQDVPPPTPKSKKHFLALTGTSKDVPPRSPLSSTGWLPRVASRELLTPRTPATPLSPWGRAPSIGAKTPTSPAFPPNLFDEPACASESRSIRKIMGQLVRHRSTTSLKDGGSANTTPKSRPIPLPVPPPPPPPIDPDAVGYLCETQENLRVVQVMLYGGNTARASDLELEVTTPGGAVVTSRSDPKVRINISLPTPVPLGQRVPFAPADGHMEAKLAALPMSATTLNSHITHALSAPSLRQLAPRSLCCTHCDHEIAEFPSDVTFKDLPSEHWSEMLEVWMCHADPAFTAHIAKQTKDGFWPTSSTVLVGGSYLLVAGSDCKTNLVEQESNEADDWRRVSCPCGEVLGKVRQSGPGAGTVRFSKWAISLMRGRGGGEIEAVRFPVSCFVVSDMLELSQAHASYRFLIADEITGSPRLALWLFNPSMHVAHRRPAKATFSLTSAPPAPSRPSWERPGLLGMRASGDRARGMRNASASRKTESPARSMRAAKIMFKLLDGADRGTEGLPGFGGPVETMRYPHDVCDSLIAALRASTTVYPVSRRALGAFSAGFLERV